MSNQQLFDYIKQQLAQGVAKEIINTNLLSQGWQQQDVDETFSVVENQNLATSQSSQISFTPRKNKKTIIFIAVGVLLLIGLGVGGFFLFSKTKSSLKTNVAEKEIPVVEVKNDNSFVCGKDTVTDADNNSYGTVLIGNQCWMSENMHTTKYPDGTAIKRGPVTQVGEWDAFDNGFYAYPPNTANNSEETLANIISNKLGFVYQWSAAMNASSLEGAQGICPAGFHIPTDNQLYILENYLKDSGESCSSSAENRDACSPAGTKLKSGGSSNFNIPLSGIRPSTGNFQGRNELVSLWSSSKAPGCSYHGCLAWNRWIYGNKATINRNREHMPHAFSVRCLKDSETLNTSPETRSDNYLLTHSFPDLVLFPSLESLLQYKFDKSPIMIESSESLPESLRFSIPIPADDWQRMPQVAVPQGALEKLAAAVSPKGLAGGYIEVLKYDLTSEISTADWLSNLFSTNKIKMVAIIEVKNPNGIFSEALGVETLPKESGRDPMVYRVAAYRNGTSIIAVRCGAAAPAFIDLAYYFAAATNYFKLNQPQPKIKL
ncbi:MAG: fibrobacter succinogenes major paralogous domain-containing protein [Patescibacteria group bacterium]